MVLTFCTATLLVGQLRQGLCLKIVLTVSFYFNSQVHGICEENSSFMALR